MSAISRTDAGDVCDLRLGISASRSLSRPCECILKADARFAGGNRASAFRLRFSFALPCLAITQVLRSHRRIRPQPTLRHCVHDHQVRLLPPVRCRVGRVPVHEPHQRRDHLRHCPLRVHRRRHRCQPQGPGQCASSLWVRTVLFCCLGHASEGPASDCDCALLPTFC